MRKICFVTGTRAEYGLLQPLLKLFNFDDSWDLQILVTGMHLAPEFGLTYQIIEADGYKISGKIEMLLSSDSSNAIVKSIGLGMIGFADALTRLQPDLMLVLGDRYEIMAAVTAAFIMRIPVVHLHGGETTEGAFDEGIRHAITKMSYLHFVAADEYSKRVIQLGEHPDRVYNVGGIGIDNIKNMSLLNRYEFEKSIHFKLHKYNILVTFHPVTLENMSSKTQLLNLFDALDEFLDLGVIFTKANSDNDGRIINQMIDEYTQNNLERAVAFTSLGQLRYLSAMQFVDGVVGNSSSGIIEAPSMRTGTVNIGDRQKGRLMAHSIIQSGTSKEDIIKSISILLSKEYKSTLEIIVNPYGDGGVADKIHAIISELNLSEINLKKSFFDIAMVK